MFWFLSPTIQNPKWVGLVALGCAFALWGAGAQAQQPTKVARIRVLGATSASANTARVEAFQLGLRELGYVEGKNIIIENRWAEHERESRKSPKVYFSGDSGLVYGLESAGRFRAVGVAG